jgi:predicted ATPase
MNDENPESPLLKSVSLTGFLSYGPEEVSIPLTPLNVVIGPNGSGKSNLVEAISVLRAVPKDLPLPIRRGGGVRDWLWRKGEEEQADQAVIETVFSEGWIGRRPDGTPVSVRHRLVFGAEGDSFVVLDERVDNEKPGYGHQKPFLYFGYENGRPMLSARTEDRIELQKEDIDNTQSILSQRRDPDRYPEITRMADILHRVLVYRSWHFGPDSQLRASCNAGVRSDYLSEEFDNLPARLAVLKRSPAVKKRLLELLSEIGTGFEDVEIIPEGGMLQLYVTENGRNFTARRLSDGTLRFLCLLAVLLDPTPPPLVAIEEPELGLHPDLLPVLRDLMVEASARCQFVVTTHSTQFVDAMTDHADSVLICEKHDGRTVLSRLTQAEIDTWREHGGLGHLWMSGHIGGTRW